MSKLINEMSEADFLRFVTKIYNDEYDTEEDHIDAILEFKRLSEHPLGSDLLFYPEVGKSGPEAVVKEIKEWRSSNGKPGFKTV
ncbi:MAG TPA: bacteriocin immunity protein [Pseudomonas sp.]|uniref:bacteriocin immunity protein n=1 Tax=Pseudomonas sp. TaxID=306 RepID=UPI000EDCB558|nr:bacteriocin immunity protein [Pseudomonas sp.]HCN66295.1 bacteriocin immunity protein [Pseudomonas sp.]